MTLIRDLKAKKLVNVHVCGEELPKTLKDHLTAIIFAKMMFLQFLQNYLARESS